MSSKGLAVSVQNLGKTYTIAQSRERPSTLAEAILQTVRGNRGSRATTTFQALKDVSFDVREGDVLGIIGRNGAGKSTLLKILSRIVEPTTGQIDLYGRIGSLLEVGTGFHPELTGRENIFLNGAILGMSQREITDAFDAIVDFAGTEKFLDTPVKRYSSGMYVRLAFAVAAHLNPEILVVDEVLAVGDAEFQQKCLGKMQDVARGGRTVLFVSHHMQSVRLLCNRAIVLKQGQLAYDGDVPGAIEHYLQGYRGDAGEQIAGESRSGTGEYRFAWVRPETPVFDGGAEKQFRWRLERKGDRVSRMYLSAHIMNAQGALVAQCDSRLVGMWLSDAEVLEGTFTFRTPWLKPGAYHLDVAVCTVGRVVDDFAGACRFDISPILPYEFTLSADGTDKGTVFADFNWHSDAGSLEIESREAVTAGGVG